MLPAGYILRSTCRRRGVVNIGDHCDHCIDDFGHGGRDLRRQADAMASVGGFNRGEPKLVRGPHPRETERRALTPLF